MCRGLSAVNIREAIVQASRMAYYRLGRACACRCGRTQLAGGIFEREHISARRP
jgi:hypothetical protein